MIEKDAAVTLALRAGEILRAGWGRDDLHIEHKGVINPVTEIDRRSEDLLKEGLSAACPGYGIVSEESDALREGAQARWIIDPLDGTVNYIKRYPLVAVSIGLEKAGELVLGVVYNPILDELYTAERGGGAWLNGRAIRVSTVEHLAQAMVATGFPYDAWSSAQDNTAELRLFVKNCLTVRTDGSAALDMCRVAAGQFDSYFEKGIGPWDVAAGTVIVREAGGAASDYQAGNAMLSRREIAASNGKVHAEVLALINQAQT